MMEDNIIVRSEVKSKYKVPGKNAIDLNGMTFEEWEVLGYLGNSKWECKCSCGKIMSVDGKSLRRGDSKSCGHETKKAQNLKDMVFGEWEVLEYSGYKNHRHYWKCVCSCGIERELDTFSLTSGHSTSCGHSKLKDITNQTFGELKTIEYIGKKQWLCECRCGEAVIAYGKDLRSGTIKNCGNPIHKVIDLKGKILGDITVEQYAGNRNWECVNSRGERKIISGKVIRAGKIQSFDRDSRLQNLEGKTFGFWRVRKYAGNREWECICKCGAIRNVNTQSLLREGSLSCGCKKSELAKQTLLDRYGDIATCRAESPREKWQLDVLESEENMKQYLQTMEHRPTTYELEQILNTDKNVILKKIHSYGLDELVLIRPFYSKGEKEVYNYIKGLIDEEVIQNYRGELVNGELDIYIPSLNLAFEYNGNYWHSSKEKTKTYHQKKTIECAKNGIHLIHIFEYEWEVESRRHKIENYIKSLISNNRKIGARETKVEQISNNISIDFADKNHISGGVNALINIGLTHGEELVAIMSFGKPRFNNDYQYELIRYCCKSGITIIGGAQKLFKHFVLEFNPESIICYTDISKFTGNVYTRLGFKISKESLTAPNYVWVSPHSIEVLSRYKTQKHRLVADGLGSEEETEDEIMERLGYFKIYDSGNLRLTWEQTIQN